MLPTASQCVHHSVQPYVHGGEGDHNDSGTARFSQHNSAHASSLRQFATDHRVPPQPDFYAQRNCSAGHNKRSGNSDAVDGEVQSLCHPSAFRYRFENGIPVLQEGSNLGGRYQSNYSEPRPETNPQAIMHNLSILERKIHQLRAILQGSVQDVDEYQLVASGVASIIYDLTATGAVILSSCQQQTASNPSPIINYSSTDLQLSAAIALGSDVLSNHENRVRHAASDRDLAGDPQRGIGKSNVLVDDHGIPSSSFQPNSMASSDPANSFPVFETVDNEIDAHDNDNWLGNSCSAEKQHMGGLGLSKEDMDSGCSFRDEDAPLEGGDEYCIDRRSYKIIEMDAVEILAEHTHFCEICGKGFKRDANLRMHMRAHGNKYKTQEALTKPDMPPQDSAEIMRPRRYSCPYVGCRRNRKHKKFQPLKSVVCVKNHYKRSHCPKVFPCTKCDKTFSVFADLKSHGKHCGLIRWQCSCGTTFSRKDKLFGHITLFEGHTPAVPMDELVDSAGKDRDNHGGTNYGNAKTTSINDCSSISGFLVDLGSNSYGSNDESLFGMGSSGDPKTEYDCHVPMRWD